MTTYSAAEIKEGREKIDALTDVLLDEASKLVMTECMSKAEIDELYSNVRKILDLSWRVVFPPASSDELFKQVSQIWTADETKH